MKEHIFEILQDKAIFSRISGRNNETRKSAAL